MRYDPKIKPEVFASQDVTGPHMTCVQLDKEAKSLVATDGYRLIRTPVADLDDDHTGPLDPEVLALARKYARAHGPVLSANGHVVLANGSTHLRQVYDTDSFPPWQRVVPSDASEVKASVRVNAKYLADVFKATGAESVDIDIRGELDPIVFRTQGELGETLMVIMPMRRR